VTGEDPGRRGRWCARSRAPGLVLMLVLGLAASAPRAEIFRYTDARGRAVFTDRPVLDPSYKLVWRSTIAQIDARLISVPHQPLHVRKWHNKSGYATLIKQVARETGVSAELLHAVIQAESAYDAQARSPAGAMGLMQLMPATAKRYGVTDVWDPEQNLSGGAHYLRDLLDMFENDLRLALAAYNAGEGAVIKSGNHIPPYPETREYVRRVIENFRAERQGSSS
jgi:soluble lytic murein transglycosylase-like protein